MTSPTSSSSGPGPYPIDDELHNADVAHEHSDINVRAIVIFMIVLTVVTTLAGGAMWGVFRVLDKMTAKNDPPQSPVAAPSGQLPPEPRLLTNEPMALQKLRSQEKKTLENYGWVDQAAGVARMPIAEAKKQLLQHGIPVRAGEPVDPRLGTRAAAMSDASSGRNAVVRQTATPPTPQTETPRSQQTPNAGHKPGGGQ